VIVLTRIDAARNMRRFYAVDVTRTLFGEWQLVREWGRIGQGDTVRACTYPARDEAEKAQAHSIIHKLQRGYIPVSSSRERHVESGNKNVDKRRLSLYK
jgi:predicted DNA-binding WGR domain protein